VAMADTDSNYSEKIPTTSVALATLAIIFSCVLWGTTGTAASFIQGISSLAVGAFAMGVSGLLMGL